MLPAGKPLHLHGSAGREYATGRGVVLASRELLKAYNMGKISGKTFVIQVNDPISSQYGYSTHLRLTCLRATLAPTEERNAVPEPRLALL